MSGVSGITITPKQARLALTAIRAGISAGWLAPVATAKVFGLSNADTEPTFPYIFRLFAVRDGALAYLTAKTAGDARTLVLQTGLVCDAFDTVAGLLSGMQRKTPLVASTLVTVTAAAAATLGVIALRED